MEPRSIVQFIIPAIFFLLIDWYAFQAFKTVFADSGSKRLMTIVYWSVTVFFMLLFALYRPVLYKVMPRSVSVVTSSIFIGLVIAKVVILLFMFGEDITRAARFAWLKVFSTSTPDAATTNSLSRSEFLSRAAIIAGAIPFGTLIYGVLANAYNYQYRKVTVRFPNLPAAFDGYRIVHLSDIHSGSFTRTEPIIEAVEKINALNADIILFTGDLVNNMAKEMDDFIPIFKQLKAKHGVFSSTGNHDYGDYVQWESREEKRANFEKFVGVHRQMGWDLLRNEHRVLENGGEKIALLGVENWGKGRFAKYGKLHDAHRGTEDIPFKILLSHDPSHWDEEVRPQRPDIDLTLSGHTHGFQFGIEAKWLKWSPSQWIYKQWAGLYQEGAQFLYVNRGFGFLGYPGRVGILPEVTEITLRRS